MPWTIIHGRDRDLRVAGAECGRATYTRDPDRALRFAGQDAARKWLDENVVGAFGEVALLREAGGRDTRKGFASHYGSRATP